MCVSVYIDPMSLTGRYDANNVFAKIMRGELPSAKVDEDENTLVIMDAFPQTCGHCLVIPKSPSRNLLEMSPGDLDPMIAQVQRVGRAVVKALSPDGVMIGQFNGAPAGQTVFHTHIHIIPRYEGAPMAGHGQAPMGDMAELKKLAHLIAEHLE